MRAILWVGFLAAAAMGFSASVGCAAPLAGIGAVAAVTLRGRAAVAALVLVWAVNQVWQVVGMSYPVDGSAVRWGLALLGLAVGCAVAPAVAWRGLRAAGVNALATGVACFALAFAVYQGGLWAITEVLVGATRFFTWGILGDSLAVNAGVFAALAALRRLPLFEADADVRVAV